MTIEHYSFVIAIDEREGDSVMKPIIVKQKKKKNLNTKKNQLNNSKNEVMISKFDFTPCSIIL
jgi:hypothetical protein